jgi:hypothetical protein
LSLPAGSPDRWRVLPQWLWLWLAPLTIAAEFVLHAVRPAAYDRWFGGERGVIENLTIYVLTLLGYLPGSAKSAVSPARPSGGPHASSSA